MVYALGVGKLKRLSQEGVNQMVANENEFRQPVSVDDAPAGSVCEWCGKPAVRQLIAQGGVHHNEGGFFCAGCSEAFMRLVAGSLSNEVKAKTSAKTSAHQ
jgi:hypothetical protein